MSASKSTPHGMRDFCEKAALLGFVFDGYHNGGHTRFINTEVGVTVTAPATASDWRSHLNVLSEMERASGRKLPRANAARYRNKPVRRLSVVRDADDERVSAAVDDLLAQAEKLRAEWAEVTGRQPNRVTATLARKVLDAYADVQSQLEHYHRTIPPITEQDRR